MKPCPARGYQIIRRLLSISFLVFATLPGTGAGLEIAAPGVSPPAHRYERVPGGVASEPEPGAVFREYLWTNSDGDAGGALRVGGKFDYGGGPILLPHDLDLDQAIRAELLIEKLLCHDGTRGLAASVNGNAWITVPEAPGIPEPQWDYMHQTCLAVPLPLRHLRSGKGNQVRLRVSPEHPWDWPQNLIYGVHIRIFYEPAGKPHPTGGLISPQPGHVLGARTDLVVEASSPTGGIQRVEFVGHYLDVNLEGDGVYTKWHHRYHRAVFTNHIGSVTSAPWRLTWDNSWVPDQPEPFRIAARIIDDSGLIYFTEPVDGLNFNRCGLSVELCQPRDVPKKWLTRTGEHAEKFHVNGDLRPAVAAQLVWTSWSPGYMEGLYLNDRLILLREGPRYACYLHRVLLDDLTMLKPGENLLRTGTTPLYNGEMVHGMELNWPGIMVLIQYQR
jgi:hypothetical protein